MPETITFGNFQLEVDHQKTAKIYKGMLFACICDFCANVKITQRRHVPKAQTDLLISLGVNPWKPCLTEFQGRKTFDRPGYGRKLSCWYLYGKIVSSEQTTEPLSFDKLNWVWADSRQTALSGYDSILDDIEGDPGLIYVFTSNEMPWYSDQVSGFKNTVNLDCQNCGRVNQIVGFLKRKSRIPAWIGEPSLEEFTQSRDSRLATSFCLKCGLNEFRIIPRRPRLKITEVIRQWDSFTVPPTHSTKPPQ